MPADDALLADVAAALAKDDARGGDAAFLQRLVEGLAGRLAASAAQQRRVMGVVREWSGRLEGWQAELQAREAEVQRREEALSRASPGEHDGGVPSTPLGQGVDASMLETARSASQGDSPQGDDGAGACELFAPEMLYIQTGSERTEPPPAASEGRGTPTRRKGKHRKKPEPGCPLLRLDSSRSQQAPPPGRGPARATPKRLPKSSSPLQSPRRCGGAASVLQNYSCTRHLAGSDRLRTPVRKPTTARTPQRHSAGRPLLSSPPAWKG
eukprot:TRINITY_DN2672_c1_g1_i1.p2 TRINITY_DN2672_c1_g1~~TRINITY_DN2672_c1_g1_i1.p2  ORF type:complete len:268 (+),score=64.87 TRINITY_DN2672_c1_g1_i1:167-970(+)